MRLHNPGCIRKSSITYQGEVVPSSDPELKEFVDDAHGFRAMVEILQAYQAHDGITNIFGAISRWSPPSDDNPTAQYALNVAQACGVTVTEPILLSSYYHPMLLAMSTQECGPGKFTDSQIAEGIELAGLE